MAHDADEKLNKSLTDVHSIEEQALVQLRRAPRIAVAPALAKDFEVHLGETEEQEEAVRKLLEQRDAEPSRLKDLAGKAGGFGMVWFAQSQPDTPVKLTAHAFSYEHLEIAAYELLRAAAEKAGDGDVAALAERIGDEERQMTDRLRERFPDAVDAALEGADPGEKLDAYLSDAHAVEAQAQQMLKAAPALVDDKELASVFEEHLAETDRHLKLVDERLDARGADASALKDAALRLGALNLGAFFKAQPDTAPKLTGFSFAFEHLEVALYEMLADVAERAGDQETAAMAREILGEERAAAEKLAPMLQQTIERHYAQSGG